MAASRRYFAKMSPYIMSEGGVFSSLFANLDT